MSGEHSASGCSDASDSAATASSAAWLAPALADVIALSLEGRGARRAPRLSVSSTGPGSPLRCDGGGGAAGGAGGAPAPAGAKRAGETLALAELVTLPAAKRRLLALELPAGPADEVRAARLSRGSKPAGGGDAARRAARCSFLTPPPPAPTPPAHPPQAGAGGSCPSTPRRLHARRPLHLDLDALPSPGDPSAAAACAASSRAGEWISRMEAQLTSARSRRSECGGGHPAVPPAFVCLGVLSGGGGL